MPKSVSAETDADGIWRDYEQKTIARFSRLALFPFNNATAVAQFSLIPFYNATLLWGSWRLLNNSDLEVVGGGDYVLRVVLRDFDGHFESVSFILYNNLPNKRPRFS